MIFSVAPLQTKSTALLLLRRKISILYQKISYDLDETDTILEKQMSP